MGSRSFCSGCEYWQLGNRYNHTCTKLDTKDYKKRILACGGKFNRNKDG